MPSVVYNGYTIPNVIDKFSYSEDEKAINFSCNFLVLSASASALNTATQEAETKLSEKYKDFSLTFGGSSAKTLSHSANTGFLAQPTLTKVTDGLALEISRKYRFSVNIQVPFDQSGYGYRREGSFAISYAPTRQRVVSFRCLYTAGSTNSALANYLAGYAAWTAGVLTALGGTYEKTAESISEEMEQKILNASITYKEILADQASGTTNVAAIVDPTVNYSMRVDQQLGIAQTSGYEATPQIYVTISYSCKIDKDQVATDTALEDVYTDTVRPWLLTHVWDMLGLADYSQAGQNYVVQSESRAVDGYNWALSGSITFSVPKTQQTIFALDETVAITTDKGLSMTPIWDGVDDTYNTWGIGRKRNATRTITIGKLGSPPNSPPDFSDGSSGVWQKRSESVRKNVKKFSAGSSGGSIVQILAYAYTFGDTWTYQVPFEILG